MIQHNITIRRLTSADLEQYDDLLRYAFQVTDKDLFESGWEDDDMRQSKYPVLQRANVLGCFDGDTLVSQFAVYPLEMNIHSVICPIGFVTSVATYPEYTGLGLMSKIMKQSLTEMRDKKQSLALLYPYSIPLYRHRGWEIVSDKMSYHIPDVQVPKKVDVPGYVRRVSEESPDLLKLHTQFARKTHGCLLRNHLAWDEYWRWDMDDSTVAIYYGEGDEPLGYMVYLLKEDILYVKEMIYLNMEARKGLWNYISAHDSMIDEVRGSNYFSEPIAFMLEDSAIKETIRPYIMGRIVDVEQFLANYRFSPEVTGTVTLHVSDPFLEWNNRSFTLSFNDGHADILQESDGCQGNASVSYRQASLSIGTLTTLLLGYKRAADLFRLERMDADEQTVRFLDHAVVHEKPYISDYI